MSSVTAQEAAETFVENYYKLLHDHPERAHGFYLECSKLGWAVADDRIIEPVTTLQSIHDKIISSVYKDWHVVVKTIDGQESVDGGLLIVVTGCFRIRDGGERNFNQTFFLARENGPYYIFNDILRVIDVHTPVVASHHDTKNIQAAAKCDSVPVCQVQDTVATHSDAAAVENINVNEAACPSSVNDAAALTDVSKSSVPPKENGQVVVKTPVNLEEAKNTSYASMVSKPTSPIEASAPICIRVSANANSQFDDDASKEASKENLSSKVSTTSNDAPSASSEVRGIYIKGLPYGITKGALIEAMKQFGRLRRVTNNVQIKQHESGFCSGFVDFELPDSAHRAVEAGHLLFGEQMASIAYKRSYNRGGNREGPSQNGNFRSVLTGGNREGPSQNGNFRRQQSAEGFSDRRSQNGNRPGSRNGESTQYDHHQNGNFKQQQSGLQNGNSRQQQNVQGQSDADSEGFVEWRSRNARRRSMKVKPTDFFEDETSQNGGEGAAKEGNMN